MSLNQKSGGEPAFLTPSYKTGATLITLRVVRSARSAIVPQSSGEEGGLAPALFSSSATATLMSQKL
jgi:hypothetical protein